MCIRDRSNTVAVGVYEALRQWGFPDLQSAGRLTRFAWGQTAGDTAGK